MIMNEVWNASVVQFTGSHVPKTTRHELDSSEITFAADDPSGSQTEYEIRLNDDTRTIPSFIVLFCNFPDVDMRQNEKTVEKTSGIERFRNRSESRKQDVQNPVGLT